MEATKRTALSKIRKWLLVIVTTILTVVLIVIFGKGIIMPSKEVNELSTLLTSLGDNDLIPVDHPTGGGDYELSKIKGENVRLTISNIKKIYTGTVGKNGETTGTSDSGISLHVPSGWSVSYTSTGKYTVTHNLGHQRYTVIMQAVGIGAIGPVQLGANSFDVENYEIEGATVNDTLFGFMLIEYVED